MSIARRIVDTLSDSVLVVDEALHGRAANPALGRTFPVDGAERMKALINGLLQYSRVGWKEGGFRLVVLDDVLDDLSRRIEETRATVTREPRPSTYGNPEQLRRVVQNVVENALIHAGDGAAFHGTLQLTPETAS